MMREKEKKFTRERVRENEKARWSDEKEEAYLVRGILRERERENEFARERVRESENARWSDEK